MLVTLTMMMMVTLLMMMMIVYTVHISRCQNEEDDYLCDRLAASGFCEGRCDSQLVFFSICMLYDLLGPSGRS